MNKSSNTLKDLFTKEEYEEYVRTEFPFNISILDKALTAKIKEDPTYEVWVPFVYCKHATRVKDRNKPSLIKVHDVFISNKGGVCAIRKDGINHLSVSLATGYPTAAVYRGHKQVMSFRLHRALASCFIPPKPELKLFHPKDLEVNHKNGIKTDFELSNLEWCTSQENVIHAVENDLLTYPVGVDHWNTKTVKGTVLYGVYRKYSFLLNGREEHEKYGFSQSKISACCLGKEKTHKNCSWAFATEDELQLLTSPDIGILKEVISHKEPPSFTIEATNLETAEKIIIKGGIDELEGLGFRKGCVWNVFDGRAKSHKGYHFVKIEH